MANGNGINGKPQIIWTIITILLSAAISLAAIAARYGKVEQKVDNNCIEVKALKSEKASKDYVDLKIDAVNQHTDDTIGGLKEYLESEFKAVRREIQKNGN